MMSDKIHLNSQGQTTSVGNKLTSFHRFNLVSTEDVLLLKSYLGAEIDIANYKTLVTALRFSPTELSMKTQVSLPLPNGFLSIWYLPYDFCYQTPLRVAVKWDEQYTDKLALSTLRVDCQ